MRRLKNGWEITGAVSIHIALASVFVYLVYLRGWYQEPTPADAIVATSLALVSLILFVMDAPG
jgi:hypothetical protein